MIRPLLVEESKAPLLHRVVIIDRACPNRSVTQEKYTFQAAATAVGISEQTLRQWHAKLVAPPDPCGDEASLAELRVAKFADDGHDVWIRVTPQYAGTSTRATGVLYQVRVDGKSLISELFAN